jgi:hypothetical protein
MTDQRAGAVTREVVEAALEVLVIGAAEGRTTDAIATSNRVST